MRYLRLLERNIRCRQHVLCRQCPPGQLRQSRPRLARRLAPRRCLPLPRWHSGPDPRVSIKYPWFLKLGDHVWLGETAWIDNHCPVRIGSHVCISQGACLFTGNHDWNDPAFRFFCTPIAIADGCWIGAGVRIGPGSAIERGTVICVGPILR